MITFTTALVLLVLGYIVYGAFVERVFGVDASRKTPCYTMADGVDYTPMPTWKVYLIQFLNIAGTGPIFGAILGILIFVLPPLYGEGYEGITSLIHGTAKELLHNSLFYH